LWRPPLDVSNLQQPSCRILNGFRLIGNIGCLKDLCAGPGRSADWTSIIHESIRNCSQSDDMYAAENP
jgi:hypothetical protein